MQRHSEPPTETSEDNPHRLPLWTGGTLPLGIDLPQVQGARFHLIKGFEPERDGYYWLKGVALARFQGQWIASFGHNTCQTGENNSTEVANARISRDDGVSWGPLLNIDDPPGDLATSHGVFLIHGEKLWAFMGAFYGKGRPGGRVHTRAFVTASVRQGRPVWEQKGVVAWDGFWPLQEPLRMDNGDFIVAGASVGGGRGGNTIPAVALVNGEDLTDWTVIRIPAPMAIWGESTVVVQGANARLIARSNKTMLRALAASSGDYGRTWDALAESNLPMADSKPYAGTLLGGRHYLINTICADVATTGRNPLSILISQPGEMSFCNAFSLVDARRPLPGAEGYTRWAYPYAVEWEGRLWIGFYMAKPGKHGSGAAGLITCPVESLR